MSFENGKFLIHVPRFSKQRGRLRTVGGAVARVAEMLEADIEVSQRTDVLSVWVFYKECGREEIPLYSDYGKDWSENDVFRAISESLQVLSLGPEHTILQTVARR